MSKREELFRILNIPIFPHEDVDPLEAVTDYLLDNDVLPVVKCKNCLYQGNKFICPFAIKGETTNDDDYCSIGRMRKTEVSDNKQ